MALLKKFQILNEQLYHELQSKNLPHYEELVAATEYWNLINLVREEREII